MSSTVRISTAQAAPITAVMRRSMSARSAGGGGDAGTTSTTTWSTAFCVTR
jgi:hypothetical protein